MSQESPHTERAKELYDTDGPRIDADLKPTPTMIEPGHFSDGQDRMGTRPENIHRGGRPDYDSHHGHKYREDRRSRPSAHRRDRKGA